MTQPNTFGFEAEFQNNVDPLISALTDRGYADQNNMHGYHCHCEEVCDFDSGQVFRAQTDSSCGGEVISKVFHSDDMDEAVEAMLHLQEVAVEMDAEPSLHAGFHVHVGKPSTRGQRLNGFLAFLRWEDVLGELAAGRFLQMRSFNYHLRQSLTPYSLDLHDLSYEVEVPYEDLIVALHPGHYGLNVEGLCNTFTGAKRTAVAKAYYHAALNMDRHSSFSVQTASGVTWEYRLWNSTRSAWRMEMFVRLSLLLADADAAADLLDIGHDVSPSRLLDVAERHDPALSPLLERQRNSLRDNGPLTLLVA